MPKLEIPEFENRVKPIKKTAFWTSIDLKKMDYIMPIIGFFVSKAKFLFSMTPFGLAFFSAAYNGQILAPIMVFIGVALGNLSGFIQFPVKYALANILFVVVASLKKDLFLKNLYLCGLLASVSLFVCGMFYVGLDGFLLYDTFKLLLECLIVFSSVLVFKKVIPVLRAKKIRTKLNHEEFLSTMILLALVITGLGNITVPFFATLQGTFAVYLILMLSVCFGAAYACPLAIAMGFLTGSYAPIMQNTIAAYSVSGLLSGIFGKFGKFASGIAFLIGNVIMTLCMGTNYNAIINPIDILFALILLLVTPKKVFVYAEESVLEQSSIKNYDSIIKDVILGKLQGISDSFFSLSLMFKEHIKSNKPTNVLDASSIFDSAAEQICQRCGKRFTCWEKNSVSTYNAMVDMMGKLENTGCLDIYDVPSHFKTSCIKIDALIFQINRIYEINKIDFLWKNKLAQSGKLVTNQLFEVSKILTEIKNSIDGPLHADSDMQLDIITALDFKGIRPDHVLAWNAEGNNHFVELSFAKKEAEHTPFMEIEKTLSQVLNAKMMLREKNVKKDCFKLTFSVQDQYFITTGAYQVNKDGERECGDSYTFLSLENGKFLCALSDGMGSGRSARMESQKIIALLVNFLKSGFIRDSAIRMINSISSLSSDEESYSTIDMALIDLNDLSIEFVKSAAIFSLIKSSDKVRKIEAATLPVGAVENAPIEVKKTVLKDGDYVVMLSDGILGEETSEYWLKNLLANIEPYTPQKIAKFILEKALENQHMQATDDLTVLVFKVERSKNQYC